MAYCRKCGAKLTEGSKFCMACGEKIVTVPTASVCPACGQAYTPGAAFCRKCGTALNKAAGATVKKELAEDLKRGAKAVVRQVFTRELEASDKPGEMVISDWME